jgi:hypothetical protein
MSEILLKLEEYLKGLKLTQKSAVFLLPFLIVAVVLYLMVIPYYEDLNETIQTQQRTFEKRIKRKSANKLTLELEEKKKDILKLKEKIQNDKDDLNYLHAKLGNLNISSFDEREWTVTLENILEKSLALNLDIDYIKNSNSKIKDIKKDRSIAAKKYIEIGGSGSYSSILEYINFIEHIGFLIEIKNIEMNKEEKTKEKKVAINFVVNFMIYGVDL